MGSTVLVIRPYLGSGALQGCDTGARQTIATHVQEFKVAEVRRSSQHLGAGICDTTVTQGQCLETPQRAGLDDFLTPGVSNIRAMQSQIGHLSQMGRSEQRSQLRQTDVGFIVRFKPVRTAAEVR
jgi:hypothetical protein